MSTCGKLNFLPIDSIYVVFSSQEMQSRFIQTKAYDKPFYSVWKKTSCKPLKVAAAKKSLPSVSLIQLALMITLIYVMTGRHFL